ncbi:MAG: hypothetical protein M1389_07285 [Chloroflexi bacterium]|nr:hypothetical protein [Chloroflexota bacterium]
MLKPVVKALAFMSNWTAWVIRQPSMLLTMIVGPFIILALFAFSNAAQGVRANVVADTQDAAWARQQLRERKVDAVLVLPPDPRQALAQGKALTGCAAKGTIALETRNKRIARPAL